MKPTTLLAACLRLASPRYVYPTVLPHRTVLSYATVLSVVLLALAPAMTFGQTSTVNAISFGGDYGDANQDADASFSSAIANADVDFDFSEDDRRGLREYASEFLTITNTNGLQDTTTVIHAGYQIANLDNQSDDPPVAGTYGYDGTDDALVLSNGAGGTNAMSVAWMPHVKKANFLNGTDSESAEVSLADSADSLSFVVSQLPTNGVARAIVKTAEGWYITQDALTAAGTYSANGATASFYFYDPDTNQVFDDSFLFGDVTGSDLDAIEAVGVLFQSVNFDGTTAGNVEFGLTSLEVDVDRAFAPADPVTVLNVAEFYDDDSLQTGTTSTLADFEVIDEPNGKLVVTIASEDSDPIQSVTYGGAPLTLAVTSGGSRIAEVYYLDDPTAGIADVVVTWGGNGARARIGAVSLGNAADGVSLTESPVSNTATDPDTQVDFELTTLEPHTMTIWVGNKNNGPGNWVSEAYPSEQRIAYGDGGSCNVTSGYLAVASPSTATYTFDGTTAAKGGLVTVAGFASAGVVETDPVAVLNVAEFFDNNKTDGLDTSTLADFEVIDDPDAKLVVTIGYEFGGPQVTGVTYGGVPMTLAIATGGNRDADIYYLDDPAPGVADIVVTWDSANRRCRIGAVSLGNAADGVSFTVGATGGTTDTLSTDVTTTSRETLVIAIGNKNNNGSSFTAVPYASENVISRGNSNSSFTSSGYIRVEAPSTNSYTYTLAGADVVDAAFAGFASAGVVQVDPVTVLNVAQTYDSNNSDGSLTSTLANFEVINDPNAKLVVTLGYELSTPKVTGVTYGGVALTPAITSGTENNSNRDADIYYLDDPAPGVADIVVTWDRADRRCRIGAVSLGNAADGVHVTAGPNTNDVAITTTTKEVVLIAVANKNGSAGAYTTEPYSTGDRISFGDGGSCGVSSGIVQVAAPAETTLSYTVSSDNPVVVAAGFASAGLVTFTPTTPVQVWNSAQFFDDVAATSVTNTFRVIDQPDAKLVVVTGGEGVTVDNITYAGAPLTFVDASGGKPTEVWYLDDPATGDNDLVVTFTTAEKARIGALSLSNAADGSGITAKSTSDTDTLAIDLTTVVPNTFIVAAKTINGSIPNVSTPYSEQFANGDADSSRMDAGYLTVPSANNSSTYTWVTSFADSMGGILVGFAPAGEAFPQPEDDLSDFDVPTVAVAPTFDGVINLGEWGGAFPLPIAWPDLGLFPSVGSGSGQSTIDDYADLSATVYYQWDATNLYVGLSITDESVILPLTGGNGVPDDHVLLGIDPIYGDDATGAEIADSVFLAEFFVAKDLGGQVTGAEVYYRTDNPGGVVDQNLVSGLASVSAVGARTDIGYSIEITIPWSYLGVTPIADTTQIGTFVLLFDNDEDDGSRDAILRSAGGNDKSAAVKPSLWHELTLSSSLQNTFDNWITRNATSVGFFNLGGDDPDGDGLDNNAEYLLNGDPGLADATTVIPVFAADADAGELTFVYDRRIDASSLGINYAIESTTSLTAEAFTTATDVDVVSVVPINDEFERVTVTVPIDVDTKFIRLNASQP